MRNLVIAIHTGNFNSSAWDGVPNDLRTLVYNVAVDIKNLVSEYITDDEWNSPTVGEFKDRFGDNWEAAMRLYVAVAGASYWNGRYITLPTAEVMELVAKVTYRLGWWSESSIQRKEEPKTYVPTDNKKFRGFIKRLTKASEPAYYSKNMEWVAAYMNPDAEFMYVKNFSPIPMLSVSAFITDTYYDLVGVRVGEEEWNFIPAPILVKALWGNPSPRTKMRKYITLEGWCEHYMSRYEWENTYGIASHEDDYEEDDYEDTYEDDYEEDIYEGCCHTCGGYEDDCDC